MSEANKNEKKPFRMDPRKRAAFCRSHGGWEGRPDEEINRAFEALPKDERDRVLKAHDEAVATAKKGSEAEKPVGD